MHFSPTGRSRQPFMCSLRWKIETPILQNISIWQINVREDKNINHTRYGVRWFWKGGRGRGVDTHVLYTNICTRAKQKYFTLNSLFFLLVCFIVFVCLFLLLFFFMVGGVGLNEGVTTKPRSALPMHMNNIKNHFWELHVVTFNVRLSVFKLFF